MLKLTNKSTNNLYEIFDCNSKEELYSLVRERSEKVQPLLNYIDYAKGNIGNKNLRIDSPETLGKYASSTELPNKDMATIIFTNAKLQPLLLERTRINKREDIIDTIKKGIEAGATHTFLAVDSLMPLKENIEILKDMLDTIMLKTVDTIHYNKNDGSLYSEKGKGKMHGLTEQYIDFYTDEHNPTNYSQKEEYLNFASFYAKEKTKELDIIEDINTIKETLKIGYQHSKQEYFGYIAYDKNNKIIKVAELSRGGISASVVDSRILLRELMFIENLKGIALYHNHPSGNTIPSDEDLNITKRLITVLEDFNIKYFDHFIIGMENVFSFADEVFGFESKNFKYQDLSLSREDVENYYLNTPVGEIPFIKQDNNFYKNLSNIELMQLYLKERKESNFVNPRAFEVMRSRNLIFKGDKVEDIEKRLDDILIQKELEGEWDLEL